MPPQAEFDFAPFSGPTGTAGRPSIDVGRLLRSNWKPLVVASLLGLSLGAGVYLFLGPVYSASTQVLVSEKASSSDAEGAFRLTGGRAEHLQLIQTDLIVEAAFKSHGLSKVPELTGARDPLKEVTDELKVVRSAGQDSSFDNVLTITYVHSNKEVARKVVQAIVDAYRDYLSDTRNENSAQLYATLFQRRQELEGEIQRLEADLQKFRRDAPIYISPTPAVAADGGASAPKSQQELTLQMIEHARDENRRRRAAVQARLATLERMTLDAGVSRDELEFWVVHALSTGTAAGGGNGSAGLGGGTVLSGAPAKAQLDQQLLAARLLEQRLLLSLGEDHTAVRNVRRQIETVLAFYRQQGLAPPAAAGVDARSASEAALGVDLVSVYRTTLQEQLRELDIDDERLDAQYRDAVAKAKEASLFEIEDQHRKDEIAQKKQQLKQLFDTIAAFDISKEQEGYRLKQISQVRVERSLMRVAKIVGAFGVLGGALVFCCIYFREWSDTSLKTLDQVQALTKSELLGSIPEFQPSPHDAQLASDSGISSSLCYYHRPASREAEAFRSVRTTLLIRMKDGERAVQVSSPEPGDGKSAMAANLAVAVAQSGKRVLLIDCDLRRPVLHGLFGAPQEVGLTDVLLREIEWVNAVRRTPVEGLSLMTSGVFPENPAELLTGPVLPELLREARSEFDLVLLDSPPILAVSDACMIAPHVDGMLLVVRMGKNKRAAAKRTCDALGAHGVHLFGVVANDLKPEMADQAGIGYDAYADYYASAPEQSRPAHLKSPELRREREAQTSRTD